MVTLNLRNLVGEIGNRKYIEGDDRVGGAVGVKRKRAFHRATESEYYRTQLASLRITEALKSPKFLRHHQSVIKLSCFHAD